MADEPIAKIEPWRTGDRIVQSKLNAMVDAINRIPQGVRPPSQILERSRQGGELLVRQFRVVSVQSDYLECHTFNGTTEGTDTYKVALPYLLRRSDFDDTGATSGTYSTFTITRNSIGYKYTSNTERVGTNSSNSTETQVIVPSYVDNDVIFAVKGIMGSTGVTDTNGKAVEWQDLNVDGRAWAEEA